MTRLNTVVIEPGKRHQFLATIIINLTALNTGLSLGWPSPTTPQLMSKDTPVGDGPMTIDQISWLTSAMNFGPVFILPICSIMIENLGRKTTGCLIALPASISWLLIIFATNFCHLLIARLFCGISMAMCYVVMPIYVAEISGDSIRGQLGSIMNLSINIGVLSAYTLGAVLGYRVFAICILSLSVIFSALLIAMPESPIHLIRKGRIEEARRALMWLKDNDQSIVDHEVQRLQNVAEEQIKNTKSVGCKDLFRDRGTIRGCLIAVALTSGEETSGMSVVLNYTATIFQLAGSSLTPNIAAIVFGVVQIFGSLLSTLAMERTGRRQLILASCSGMAICHCTLAIFLLLARLQYNVSSLAWVPVTVLSLFAVMYNVGIGAAGFVVASEVFSADISSFANSISVTIFSLIGFSLTKLFPLSVNLIGLDNCFFVFASFCMCTFFFTYFMVPETKGRAIESILRELNGLVGERRVQDVTCSGDGEEKDRAV